MSTFLIILIVYLVGVFLAVGMLTATRHDEETTLFGYEAINTLLVILTSWIIVVVYIIVRIAEPSYVFGHVWFKYSRLNRTWRDTLRLYKKLSLYLLSVLLPTMIAGSLVLAIIGINLLSGYMTDVDLFLQVFYGTALSITFIGYIAVVFVIANKTQNYLLMCASDLTW